jgi:DNA (cytosine-5)-methyltransferase 1
LLANSLPRNVETHWLSQTLSYGDTPWTRDRVLRTTPKAAGPLLIDIVNTLEERHSKNPKQSSALARGIAVVILIELIKIRNKNKVLLTRPKGLLIDQIIRLLNKHVSTQYDKNAPRLPQLAIYAIYKCLVRSATRYRDFHLEPLGRMKAADRKSNTVGDVVLTKESHPIEAVETKLGIPIGIDIVSEAIEKIRAGSVERYLILSTAGIAVTEAHEVERLCLEFRASNGCEIIVNGVLETIRYYLRLLNSANDFILEYVELVESDIELEYQHRIAWNQLCAELNPKGI